MKEIFVRALCALLTPVFAAAAFSCGGFANALPAVCAAACTAARVCVRNERIVYFAAASALLFAAVSVAFARI